MKLLPESSREDKENRVSVGRRTRACTGPPEGQTSPTLPLGPFLSLNLIPQLPYLAYACPTRFPWRV